MQDDPGNQKPGVNWRECLSFVNEHDSFISMFLYFFYHFFCFNILGHLYLKDEYILLLI